MSKPTTQLKVALRRATASDDEFLRTLFASTRTNELAQIANPDQAKAFVDLQFRIQQQNYFSCYPTAENNIILLAQESIGRILIARQVDALRLVDISLLSKFRGRGIGSHLIADLQQESAARQQPLRLSVFKLNPALRLYERLGFTMIGDEGMYYELAWRSLPQSF